jgi:hypothetical protein
MREALAAVATAGCDLRILTIDAQNPALACMLNPDVTTSVAGQAERLADARSWFANAIKGGPHAEVRALRHGMLFQQVIVSDDQMLVSPYLYTANTGYSPRLEISIACPVFRTYLREFTELWNANPALTTNGPHDRPNMPAASPPA